MGVFNFLMRQMSKSPAIVETTKTVVRQYKYFINKYPKLDKQEIYRKIIEQRYEQIPLEDESKFKSRKSKKIWELSQLINYGLDGVRLSTQEIEGSWQDLKNDLDLERARMLEYFIWGKVYSLGSRNKFWNLSPKTTK